MLSLIGPLSFSTSPDVGSLRGRFTFRRLFLVSFAHFHILDKLAPLDQSFDEILKLDAFVSVMVIAFMKAKLLQLIIQMNLSNRVRGSDPSLPEFSIDTIPVDLFSRNSQISVLVVLSLHTSAVVVPLPMGIFSCRVDGIGVSRDRIIEVRV